ncbi:hypothetical protein QYF50_07240 [Paenibacillus vini]|uniref:hypothetical protein n=1 Tax=Paenibacillus vini TaxID=1476024 RepID=UPI0025B71489|nr:hypothetical protein [Paenibacillus vini]MDN4067686.1 hypothetical protein [Paenibacillus vini]
MKLFERLFLFQGNKNKESIQPSSSLAFEVIEKSKVHSDGEYHYKALLCLENDLDCTKENLSVIAGEIQQVLGHHPVGYHSYGLEFEKMGEGRIKLTWKSWDSCD